MSKEKQRFPPFTTPFGLHVTEVLVDGDGGCEWTNKHDKWNCTPKKGGDCDRKDSAIDSCQIEAYILIKGKEAIIFLKCICANSAEDLT